MPRFAAPETYPPDFFLARHFGAGDAHAVAARDGPVVELFLHAGAGGDGVALWGRVEGDDEVGRGAVGLGLGGGDGGGEVGVVGGPTCWSRVWAQLLLCDRGRLGVVGEVGPAAGA